MLSFFTRPDAHRGVDLGTDGSCACVYAGGHDNQVPDDTTRLRVDKRVKRERRAFYLTSDSTSLDAAKMNIITKWQ